MASSSATSSGQTAKNERASPLLTIVRHPESVGNVAHVLQGSTDSPLSVHGQAQLAALCAAVKAAHGSANSDMGPVTNRSISPLTRPGRRPTKILVSPIGRALQLGRGLAEALSKADGKIENILEVRPDLAERCFGALEGTRKGIHVAGFPHGKDPRENADVWARRVRRETQYIYSLLRNDAHAEAAEGNTGGTEDPVPHIVVVTHGLWIGTFCALFVPDKLSFMGNTAILSLVVRAESQALFGPTRPEIDTALPTTRPAPIKLTMLSAGDVGHLSSLKRQRGGIGSSASDQRQRTLQTMWSPSKKPKTDEETDHKR